MAAHALQGHVVIARHNIMSGSAERPGRNKNRQRSQMSSYTGAQDTLAKKGAQRQCAAWERVLSSSWWFVVCGCLRIKTGCTYWACVRLSVHAQVPMGGLLATTTCVGAQRDCAMRSTKDVFRFPRLARQCNAEVQTQNMGTRRCVQCSRQCSRPSTVGCNSGRQETQCISGGRRGAGVRTRA